MRTYERFFLLLIAGGIVLNACSLGDNVVHHKYGLIWINALGGAICCANLAITVNSINKRKRLLR